ncbi:MAG: hypothetical protein ACXVKH_14390, partial [Candidatus Angelobacter sp.]
NSPDMTRRAKGPLVVIANYVFDSLPQGAFIVANGELSEALLTTTRAELERKRCPPAAQQSATLFQERARTAGPLCRQVME